MDQDDKSALALNAAKVAGIASSLLFAAFLPILYPIYLWESWSDEHRDRDKG